MPYRVAAVLGLLTLTGGALAQTAQPLLPDRQPRAVGANPVAGVKDLDATRKQFEIDAAKQAASDRKRDEKLNHSMRSICAGCGGAPMAKPARSTGLTSGTVKRRASPKDAVPPE